MLIQAKVVKPAKKSSISPDLKLLFPYQSEDVLIYFILNIYNNLSKRNGMGVDIICHSCDFYKDGVLRNITREFYFFFVLLNLNSLLQSPIYWEPIFF